MYKKQNCTVMGTFDKRLFKEKLKNSFFNGRVKKVDFEELKVNLNPA
ncbi:MAG: hypothetical protein AABZ11_04345 [Nitrospinota bacterium]|jgi:hypothetical protein